MNFVENRKIRADWGIIKSMGLRVMNRKNCSLHGHPRVLCVNVKYDVLVTGDTTFPESHA